MLTAHIMDSSREDSPIDDQVENDTNCGDAESNSNKNDASNEPPPATKTKQTMKLRRCSFEEGCNETVMRGKSGPWMCKYHRNKTYKETYKKKKGKYSIPMTTQQRKHMGSMNGGGDGSGSGLGNLYGASTEQSREHMTMLSQVLNDKKLALMKSPMVQAFLQEQQQTLCNTRQPTLELTNNQMM